MPPDNIMAKSETNHSGLFSDTKRHLSPSLIFSLIIFESLNIFSFVSSHVNVFYYWDLTIVKKHFYYLVFLPDKKIIQLSY